MASGNLTEQIALIGKIAADGDVVGVKAARNKMVGAICMSEPFAHVGAIRGQVDLQIATLAAMLPWQLGTEALQLFAVDHPVFGREIPEEVSFAQEAGRKLTKEWIKRKQTEAETAKKLAQAAKLGVVLPDGEEEVSTDQAGAILQAIRKQRALGGDAIAASEVAEREAQLAAARAAKMAAMIAPPETEADGDEGEDPDYCDHCEELVNDCSCMPSTGGSYCDDCGTPLLHGNCTKCKP